VFRINPFASSGGFRAEGNRSSPPDSRPIDTTNSDITPLLTRLAKEAAGGGAMYAIVLPYLPKITQGRQAGDANPVLDAGGSQPVRAYGTGALATAHSTEGGDWWRQPLEEAKISQRSQPSPQLGRVNVAQAENTKGRLAGLPPKFELL
jgi:hypothetical protein